MRAVSFHARRIAAPIGVVGALIDTLASADDRLWPWEHFLALKLDRPLGVGAAGGHGPVRYHCVEYVPGRRAVFAFDAPSGIMAGFRGRHWFEALEIDAGTTELRHIIVADLSALAGFFWWLAIETLHDATVQAGLAKAELAATGRLAERFAFTPSQRRWMKLSGDRGRFDREGRKADWFAG